MPSATVRPFGKPELKSHAEDAELDVAAQALVVHDPTLRGMAERGEAAKAYKTALQRAHDERSRRGK